MPITARSGRPGRACRHAHVLCPLSTASLSCGATPQPSPPPPLAAPSSGEPALPRPPLALARHLAAAKHYTPHRRTVLHQEQPDTKLEDAPTLQEPSCTLCSSSTSTLSSPRFCGRRTPATHVHGIHKPCPCLCPPRAIKGHPGLLPSTHLPPLDLSARLEGEWSSISATVAGIVAAGPRTTASSPEPR